MTEGLPDGGSLPQSAAAPLTAPSSEGAKSYDEERRMTMRKYELTEETKRMFGRTLHRIRAVRDFGDVHAGDLGGWIAKEDNLSHSGSAWVYEEAMVFDDAKVRSDAKVRGAAVVFNNAIIDEEAEISGDAVVSGNAHIWGQAKIAGNARVTDHAHVWGQAQVDGYAGIGGNARIAGDTVVCGGAKLFDNTTIRGGARITSAADRLCIGSVGSRDGYITFYRGWEGAIKVACGCFDGTIDEFAEQVDRVHGDNRCGRAYRAAIVFARAVLSDEQED